MIIGGQILDEKGNPLPGVNIFIDPVNMPIGLPSRGTTTDISGNWSMDYTRPQTSNNNHIDEIMTISFMGYKTQRFAISKLPRVIKLQVDNKMINNVTVTAQRNTANMDLVGKLMFGGLILLFLAKGIPSFIADAKNSERGKDDRGLNGFKKVSL